MRCTVDGCGDEARFAYVWAWGDSGTCCDRHRFILGQQSRRLNRPVTVSPLDPGAPTPIRQDERISYHARILALQEELAELQARGLTLSESHNELVRQVRTLNAQKTTAESELQAHRERVAELAQDLAKAQKAAGQARAEVDRLNTRLAAYDLDSSFLDTVHVPPQAG